VTDQNQLENMQYRNYVRYLITSDMNVHVSTRDFESSTYVTKPTFKKKNSFHQQAGIKFKEETTTILHTEPVFVRCWNLGHTGKVDQKYMARF
jgi:hypothetical protein